MCVEKESRNRVVGASPKKCGAESEGRVAQPWAGARQAISRVVGEVLSTYMAYAV